MKITTKSGFSFEADADQLDDWRVIEAIADAADTEDTNAQLRGVATLVKVIFGKEKKALYEHIAGKHGGRVPTEVVQEDIQSVFDQMAAVKNSRTSQG